MNPLVKYLIAVLKNEKTNDTRTYQQSHDALNELGYWCLARPANIARHQMPVCKISQECVLVDEFPCYQPPFCGYAGFDMIIDVYADQEVAE